MTVTITWLIQAFADLAQGLGVLCIGVAALAGVARWARA